MNLYGKFFQNFRHELNLFSGDRLAMDPDGCLDKRDEPLSLSHRRRPRQPKRLADDPLKGRYLLFDLTHISPDLLRVVGIFQRQVGKIAQRIQWIVDLVHQLKSKPSSQGKLIGPLQGFYRGGI